MGEIRIGTSGWSYPGGKGSWNGIFYPVPAGRRPRGAPKFDELAFYAEHFDTVEINSSLGGAHAARLRVLAQAVSEVHPPEHVRHVGR